MSKQIAISLLDRSPWADLFDHPEEHIAALAEDIKERGIQTPLQVYPRDDRFELLTGHDRLEAAKRVGLTEVPIEVRSMLSDEDERFRHFIADNTHRKDINKRRMARAVIERHPDWSLTMVVRLAACSVGLAHDERQNAERERPELFTREKSVGTDGVQRPAKMPPREPKLRTDKPDRVPSALEQLRAAREAQAPAESAAFPITAEVETVATVPEPEGYDVAGEMQRFHEERKNDPYLIVQAFITALPTATKIRALTPQQLAQAANDPRFDELTWKLLGYAEQAITRIKAHKPTSEARSA